MGWNTACDKKCPCKGKKQKTSCEFRNTPVCYADPCPTVQMASVPILEHTVKNNFNPNDACEKYTYMFVVDALNKRTWFYDAYGIPQELFTGGGAVKKVNQIAETKQNKIAEYKPETIYKEGDLIIRDGELKIALHETTGAFNDAFWGQLGETKEGKEKTKKDTKPFIIVAALPDTATAKTDKFYILPNGDTFVFAGETLGFIKLSGAVAPQPTTTNQDGGNI